MNIKLTLAALLFIVSHFSHADSTKEITIYAQDSAPLHVAQYFTANSKKILIAVHGMLEHGGRWTEFANHYQAIGYTVYTTDLRGHGLSGGKKGHIKKFQQYVEDLKTITARIAEFEPQKDIVIIGYSLGGLISFSYGSEGFHPNVKGLVAISPGLSIDPPIFLNWVATLLNNPLTGKVKVKPLEPKDLTSSEIELASYKADLLVLKKITVHLGREAVKQSYRSKEKIKNWKYPLLILQSAADKIIDAQGNEDLLKHTPTNVFSKVITYQNGAKHDLLHGTPLQKEAFYADLDWYLKTEF